MNVDRVLVRRIRWFTRTSWEVLCPCCAARVPGVAVLKDFGSWQDAVEFADTHGRAHP